MSPQGAVRTARSSWADRVQGYGLCVFPLFWEGEPLVHTQDTLLPLTPGTSWTSSALWPQEMGLRPLLCLLAPGAPIRDMERTPQG